MTVNEPVALETPREDAAAEPPPKPRREPMTGPGLRTLVVAFVALYLVGGWLVPAALHSAKHKTSFVYSLCKRGVVMTHLWTDASCRGGN